MKFNIATDLSNSFNPVPKKRTETDRKSTQKRTDEKEIK